MDPADTHDESGLQALAQSFAMIIVSEIGDKTFLIAAILAMRHPRMVVFAGAFGSLVVMSMLSAGLGHLLPTLIPKKWTQTLAAILFLVFGIKMLQEAREMKAGNDKIREEMKEAEEEIEGDEAGHEASGNGRAIPLEDLEEGGRARHARSRSQSNPAQSTAKNLLDKSRNYCSILLGPHFTQAFVLTFLGEWGDRSQISTIALGAAHVRTEMPGCIPHSPISYYPGEHPLCDEPHSDVLTFAAYRTYILSRSVPLSDMAAVPLSQSLVGGMFQRRFLSNTVCTE
jgi:Ca2+/H+ antiporter, TMEM165/GDT1 family